MITVTKKANANGCPLVNGGAPPGCIPIVIVDDTRTINCWLRVASPLFVSVNIGAPVNVDDAELVLRRVHDFVMGHARTVAERAAEADAIAADGVDEGKKQNARTVIQAYCDNVRAIAAGSRTPEQRAIYAMAKLSINRE